MILLRFLFYSTLLQVSLCLTGQEVTSYTFEIEIRKQIKAEKYTFEVPENRNDPDSRLISLSFVRLATRSDNPANPIVYLAGGPGGSGTGAMKGRRWKLFDSLRNIADVIIFDQRGTGLSSPLPRCVSGLSIHEDSATTRDYYVKQHQRAAEQCVAFWEKEGVDLYGYTTWESAADIEELRKVLGVDKVSLLGISYGTHLALATLKRYPDRIDRLLLASAEGLDQTVKLPSRTDAYLDRLQQAIDKDPEAKAAYPDIRKLLGSVLEQVEENPRSMLVDDDPEFRHTFGKFEMQRITSYMLSDPGLAASVLEGYLDASKGNFSWFRNYLDWYVRDNTISFDGMALAMDLASGISDQRLEQVNEEARTALLGDAVNFPMPHLRNLLPDLDLGKEYRRPVESGHPILFISGTLDGRTYPEAHEALAKNHKNSSTVTIENAGHNLFFSHPELPGIIREFFEGETIKSTVLEADLPSFVPD